MRKIFVAIMALVFVMMTPLKPLAHESPVDHVDRGIKIWITGGIIHLSYQLQLSERAAMMQLNKMDSDADGIISDRERDAFFAPFSESLAKQLHLQVGEKQVEMKPDGAAKLLPQFRQVYRFSGTLGALEKGKHFGKLIDDYSRSYPGAYRWDGPKNGMSETGEPIVTVTEAPKAVEAAGHPGVLVLKFEVAVP